jgi:hypothetical protein
MKHIEALIADGGEITVGALMAPQVRCYRCRPKQRLGNAGEA